MTHTIIKYQKKEMQKISTIAVAPVSGVYFPGQRLQFKIKNPSRRLQLSSGKTFGIITKTDAAQDSKGTFEDHHEYGVTVDIVEQKQVYSTLTNDSIHILLIEASQRFKINRVLHSSEDKIVKICEVTLFDDTKEFQASANNQDERKK